MFEYKTKHYRTLKIEKTERSRNMAKAKHTIIVARDGTNIGASVVEVWPEDADLKKIEEEWVLFNKAEKITTLFISLFKEIFGYEPAIGSIETKTIDEATLNAMGGKVLLTC